MFRFDGQKSDVPLLEKKQTKNVSSESKHFISNSPKKIKLKDGDKNFYLKIRSDSICLGRIDGSNISV